MRRKAELEMRRLDAVEADILRRETRVLEKVRGACCPHMHLDSGACCPHMSGVSVTIRITHKYHTGRMGMG